MRINESDTNYLDRRLAERLATLRKDQGWTLDDAAERSGVSRASLSRIERGEISPTASVLGRLCKAFKVPMAVLFSASEDRGLDLVPASEQSVWTDPHSGFRRRSLSPARPGYKGAVILGELPAGATISYPDTPIPELEHHLWLQSGALEMRIGSLVHRLSAGDCLRFKLTEGNSYFAPGPETARYVLTVISP
ncbi:helix-turn-helix domain-containing protein [Roseibium sp.]|uniref:helix-turn-helix domain-containing protein n=1 Tax=Roseibium sp. TaxID=1936156 RepID=UPI003A971C05